MIRFTRGNLLDAEVDAIVNTVNTVGVMGKGIALMFKERFPENFRAYASACKRGEVQVGRMFVTASPELSGPRWIVNFPTKKHWRHPTKVEWIEEGLRDLRKVIRERDIRSIAVPPLGCGNGGLDWSRVRPLIEESLGDLLGVEVLVFAPTRDYQNVAKARGEEKLTPARALIVEMVRRYSVLGFDCSILEVQKLAWMLERSIQARGLSSPLALVFVPHKFGPFAQSLTHLLDAIDGSYLRCEKRLADASPFDTIRFESERASEVKAYLDTPEAAAFGTVLEDTDSIIDGFQSPLGMEVLATVDWLLSRNNAEASVAGIRTALRSWAGDPVAAERKLGLFTDNLIRAALERLRGSAVLG